MCRRLRVDVLEGINPRIPMHLILKAARPHDSKKETIKDDGLQKKGDRLRDVRTFLLQFAKPAKYTQGR